MADQTVIAHARAQRATFSSFRKYLDTRMAKSALAVDDLLSEVEQFRVGGESWASPMREPTGNLIRHGIRQFASALRRANCYRIRGPNA